MLTRLLLDGLGVVLGLGFAALSVSGAALVAAAVASLLAPTSVIDEIDADRVRRGRARELRRYAAWWIVAAAAWAALYGATAWLRAG